MPNDSFGERLREIREKHKKSRNQVAKDLNISPHTISGYENGHRTPNIDLVRKLADYFNVSTDWLLGRTDSSTGIHVVPKWIAYQYVILAKMVKELKENKDIVISDTLEEYLNLLGNEALLSPDAFGSSRHAKLSNYELVKVIFGPNAKPDHEEELGYDLIEKQILESGFNYLIYVCGDNSMATELMPADRVLIQELDSVSECKDKDIIVFKNDNDFLIRRLYKNNDQIVLQANNPDYPPIVIPADKLEIIGKFDSILKSS